MLLLEYRDVINKSKDVDDGFQHFWLPMIFMAMPGKIFPHFHMIYMDHIIWSIYDIAYGPYSIEEKKLVTFIVFTSPIRATHRGISATNGDDLIFDVA